MVKKSLSSDAKQPAAIHAAEISPAIEKLQRRLNDFESADPMNLPGSHADFGDSLCSKLEGTLAEIFGVDSLEYEQACLSRTEFYVMIAGRGQDREVLVRNAFWKARSKGILKIRTLLDQLNERVELSDMTSSSRALRAYGDLSLHPEIERAADVFFKDGHYATAVESSVKALNGFVRLRSGLAIDGDKLMTTAFSPNNPVLRFNELQNESDRDEQRGFMMLFAGAVAGLRNPRAHSFIQDDPERALEFIAFVSLLAKLLEGATRAIP